MTRITNQILFLRLPVTCQLSTFLWLCSIDVEYPFSFYKEIVSNDAMAGITAVLSKFYNEYTTKTPKKLKIIDAYLLYILLTGAIQFVYCLLVGTFPFNSFLSGFISCVSSFVLAGRYFRAIPIFGGLTGVLYFFLGSAVCLRLQVNPENKSHFQGISPERGYADFIFAHIVLHIVVMNFIG